MRPVIVPEPAQCPPHPDIAVLLETPGRTRPASWEAAARRLRAVGQPGVERAVVMPFLGSPGGVRWAVVAGDGASVLTVTLGQTLASLRSELGERPGSSIEVWRPDVKRIEVSRSVHSADGAIEVVRAWVLEGEREPDGALEAGAS